jgi:hypothetical protein
MADVYELYAPGRAQGYEADGVAPPPPGAALRNWPPEAGSKDEARARQAFHEWIADMRGIEKAHSDEDKAFRKMEMLLEQGDSRVRSFTQTKDASQWLASSPLPAGGSFRESERNRRNG